VQAASRRPRASRAGAHATLSRRLSSLMRSALPPRRRDGARARSGALGRPPGNLAGPWSNLAERKQGPIQLFARTLGALPLERRPRTPTPTHPADAVQTARHRRTRGASMPPPAAPAARSAAQRVGPNLHPLPPRLRLELFPHRLPLLPRPPTPVSAGSGDAAPAPPAWTGARAPGAPASGAGQGHRAGWRRGDLRLEVREVAALVALGEAVRAWRAARRRQAPAGRARLHATGGRGARAQRAAGGRGGWALHRRTCARTPDSPLRWGFAFPCRARMDWVSGALGWRRRVGAERQQGCRVCPSQRALHSRSRAASPRLARGVSVLSGAKVRHRTLPSLGLDRRLRARRA